MLDLSWFFFLVRRLGILVGRGVELMAYYLVELGLRRKYWEVELERGKEGFGIMVKVFEGGRIGIFFRSRRIG